MYNLKMDDDLDFMSKEQLVSEVVKLRSGVRHHRDATGHNLCWFVPELWKLLPEGYSPEPEVPPWDEFMRCCAAYRASLDPMDKERR